MQKLHFSLVMELAGKVVTQLKTLEFIVKAQRPSSHIVLLYCIQQRGCNLDILWIQRSLD